MARADVIVAGGLSGNFRNGTQSAHLVETPAGVLYYVYLSGVDNGLYWIKSTDNGISFTDPVMLSGAGLAVVNFAVWYDKDTPGNSGTLIHVAYIESSNDDVLYRNLDTNGDTMSTATTVEAMTSTGTVANCCIAITRAIGGDLYVLYDIDGGTEIGFANSDDVGANWTSTLADTAEGADYFLLAPGFALDTQDIICIFWDRSASEISRKLYDASGDAWAETSIVTSMTAIASSTATPHFSIAVDDANNKIMLIAWNNRDTALADLRFFSIDESTITEGTPVVSNGTDDQTLCAIGIQAVTLDVYAFYGGKSDGSETVGTAIHIYYKISTDDGATWGAETKLTEAAHNFDVLYTSPIFYGDPTAIYLAQTTGIDNLLISAVLPSGGAGGGSPVLGSFVIH